MCSNQTIRPMRSSANLACPNCCSDDREDCRTDERIYAEAARDVPLLRHEGRIGEALEILTALHAIQISNILKPRWLCLACGARYDD